MAGCSNAARCVGTASGRRAEARGTSNANHRNGRIPGLSNKMNYMQFSVRKASFIYSIPVDFVLLQHRNVPVFRCHCVLDY